MVEVDLSLMHPAMRKSLQDTMYGEGENATDEERKMMIQSTLSRYMSGKSEFGGPTMKDLLKKG